MAISVGMTGGAGAESIELLRQSVIVRLLRSSMLELEALDAYVKDLFRQQVLTQDVQLEVDELLLERGAPDSKLESLKVEGLCSSKNLTSSQGHSVLKPISRFDQDFEKVKLLGQGGFGEVWRVRNRVDQKEYAVKVVPFTFNADEDPLSHPALREAHSLAGLQHQHIVRYHASWIEVDGEDEQPFTNDIRQSLTKYPTPATCASSAECKPIDTSCSTSLQDYSSDLSDGGIVFESSMDSRTSHHLPKSQSNSEACAHAGTPRPTHTKHARLFLQMEVVDHGSLREWIDERNAATKGCIDCAAELRIFSQLVDAVAHLHAEGLVHRDIKPANILLAGKERVRLGDFGLLEASMEQGLMAPSSPPASRARAVGTPSYASPEQLQGSRPDVKADIYSLGVVLVELLYAVGTQMERASLLDDVRARRLPAHADQAAAALALRLTSPNAAERPSMIELQQCLRECVA